MALPFSNFPAEYGFILLKIISCFIRTKGMGLIFCILVSSIRTIAPKARKIFGNKPPDIISSTDFIVFYHNLRKIQNHIIKKYFFFQKFIFIKISRTCALMPVPPYLTYKKWIKSVVAQEPAVF